MRSGREIYFRLRQEALNYGLYLRPPGLPAQLAPPPAPLASLPDPGAVAQRLQGTAYAGQLLAHAEQILAHRFDLLGHAAVETGTPIAWRRDYHSGRETPLGYFRRIPYLDASQVGDQKMVWEINRHAHLVVLAQAWRLGGDQRYLARIVEHLEDWWRENPFHQGMNWTAALEVAFRAMAWIWVYHLAGSALAQGFRRRLLTELYRHGWHLEYNVSLYASPNTHLLGEAVAWHAIATLFPQLPRAARWRREAAGIVQGHMQSHVLADGMYFEQSTYYHVYALDMFLFHALLEPVPDEYRQRLRQMAELTADLAGPSRTLPFFGDDDGGRWFHPYGPREQFCRGSLAAAGRWLGVDFGGAPADAHELADWWLAAPAAPAPRRYTRAPRCQAGSGLAILLSGSAQVIVDAGAFGAGTAGHSHADALSLVVRDGDETLLLDPGTYRYMSEPEQREWFRSTAAHNTLRIDGRDQADPVNLFRWSNVPQVEVLEWVTSDECDWLHASCRYRDLAHHRRVAFLKRPRLVVVLDEAIGVGEHELEQFWHTGPNAVPAGRSLQIGRARLLSASPAGAVDYLPGWHSPAFGVKQAGHVMRVRQRGALPMVLGAVLDLDGRCETVELAPWAEGWRLRLPGWQIDLTAAPGVPGWETRGE